MTQLMVFCLFNQNAGVKYARVVSAAHMICLAAISGGTAAARLRLTRVAIKDSIYWPRSRGNEARSEILRRTDPMILSDRVGDLVEEGISVLNYQPFVLTDDIQTGVGYSWIAPGDVRVNPPLVFRRSDYEFRMVEDL